MTYPLIVVADLVLIGLLTGTYYRTHRRRDLVLAFLSVNVGVLAVTTGLAHSGVGAGLGLGLFGVLSIIRLRSEELAQHEIAYYFAALTTGLLAGFGDAGWWPLPLMASVTATILIADPPRLLAGYQRQQFRVDAAIADPVALRDRVAQIVGAEVVSVTVHRLDLVDDSTLVEVRYRATRLAAATDLPTATAPV